MAKRILVVDDEPDLLKMITARLKSWGYEVLTSSDGQGALTRVREELPDLVLLDLMLPKLNGHEVCVLLKQDVRYAQIPVIMLTARAQAGDRRLAQECGADGYLSKPYQAEELRGTIESLLARDQVPPTDPVG